MAVDAEKQKVNRAVWSAGHWDEVADYVKQTGSELLDAVGVEPPSEPLVELLGPVDIRDGDDDDLEFRVDRSGLGRATCRAGGVLLRTHRDLLERREEGAAYRGRRPPVQARPPAEGCRPR